jgi:hypothetical protein
MLWQVSFAAQTRMYSQLQEIPNAGVSEIGTFDTLKFQNGSPVKPNLLTADINLTGVFYSQSY